MERGSGASGSMKWAAALAPFALAVFAVVHAGTGGGPWPRLQGAEQEEAVEQGPADVAPVEVDVARSVIVAVTGKAGLMRFLGHDHAVLARSWNAEVGYDPARPEATSLEVVVDAAALEIDSPEAREAAGLDADGPDGDDLREIAEKMRGPEYLAVEEYPEIRFASSSVTVGDEDPGAGPRELEVSGVLTIRGHARRLSAPLRVETLDEGWRVTGALEIELRDFGMEPESIAGLVKVANEVDIRLDVHAAAVHPEAGQGDAAAGLVTSRRDR